MKVELQCVSWCAGVQRSWWCGRSAHVCKEIAFRQFACKLPKRPHSAKSYCCEFQPGTLRLPTLRFCRLPIYGTRRYGFYVGKALGNDSDRKNGFEREGWDPSLEIEVPAEQRPANELAALKEGELYSWAQLSSTDFAIRLAGLWLIFFVFLGGPIASASFQPANEPLRFLLAGGAGSVFAVAVVILRLYLGWSYVGNRLISAVVPYEETGWHDGQLWVKPPEVLARDRLLGAYQVKPALTRLKRMLLGAGVLLATTTISLFLLADPQELQTVAAVGPNKDGSRSLDVERNIAFRKKDLLHLPTEVVDNDELAAAAAAAAKGRPVYCSDRFYRALAGGQYCKWEDLIK